MDHLQYFKVRHLKEKPPDDFEPVADKVGTYELSLMIARKTGFRVMDCKAVLDAFCDASFLAMLDRKTIDLKRYTIRQKWHKNVNPYYQRSGGDEYWVFGYFLPEIDLKSKSVSVYCGRYPQYGKDIFEELLPFTDKSIETKDELKRQIEKRIIDTSRLGKRLLVDEEGYLIKPKRKKKIYFDENFHPTWVERQRYKFIKAHISRDYWKRVKRGEYPGLPFKQYLYKALKDRGFQVGPTRQEGDEYKPFKKPI